MREFDWSDRDSCADGEWVTWAEFNERFPCEEPREKHPNAIRSMIPYFKDLVSLAESYHLATGSHLHVYGDIGELFGAITYGIRLNKPFAQGADGRLGNDHVEIKTIAPFNNRNEVSVKLGGNWSKLLVVKIDKEFRVSGRMIDRRKLPKTKGKYLRVRWQDLPLGSDRLLPFDRHVGHLRDPLP